MDNPLIFPACYLPPTAYFRIIHASAQPIVLDGFEHYPKQTYRTRASVYSANGKLDLIVPVERGNHGHTPMKDVRISYEFDWQRLHWTTLQTAYRSSAYFEYYEDELAPFYQQRYERLFEYNMALLQLMLRLLKIERPVGFTESYLAEYAPGMDYRRSLHPKKPSPVGDGPQYYQVFESKHGFIPNLSIVDLLFNHGPQSTSYL